MYAAEYGNDQTAITNIDSHAVTASPKWQSSKQAVNWSDFPILNMIFTVLYGARLKYLRVRATSGPVECIFSQSGLIMG